MRFLKWLFDTERPDYIAECAYCGEKVINSLSCDKCRRAVRIVTKRNELKERKKWIKERDRILKEDKGGVK